MLQNLHLVLLGPFNFERKTGVSGQSTNAISQLGKRVTWFKENHASILRCLQQQQMFKLLLFDETLTRISENITRDPLHRIKNTTYD